MPDVQQIQNLVRSKFSRFGPNKHQELTRLIFEVVKREKTSPETLLSGLPTGVKTFAAIKHWLVKRRYPDLSASGFRVGESFSAVEILPENKMDLAGGLSLHPREVLVERSVQESELAGRISRVFPEAVFKVIESYKEFFAGVPFTPVDYNRRLERFFLVRERVDFFKACPCSNKVVSCGYHNANLGFGCPFECSYCFLQNYANAPGIVFPANLDDFFRTFEGYGKAIRVGSGETTDSLAFDHITGFSPRIVEYFRGRPESLFEFKTKSNNIGGLLSIEAVPNIVAGWSMNPQAVIDREEFYTASLKDRLAAAKALAKVGYSTAFHFDPIFYYPGWEKDYAEVVEAIFASVPEASVRWISLGTLRMTPSQKKMIENRFPENTILDAELLTAPDGKIRYHETVRREIYRKMLMDIRRHTQRDIVYLCMEPLEMWQGLGIRFCWENWDRRSLEAT